MVKMIECDRGVPEDSRQYITFTPKGVICKLCQILVAPFGKSYNLAEHLEGIRHKGKVNLQSQKEKFNEYSIVVKGYLNKLKCPEIALADYFSKYAVPTAVVLSQESGARKAIVTFDENSKVKEQILNEEHKTQNVKLSVYSWLTYEQKKAKIGNQRPFELPSHVQNLLLQCDKVSQHFRILYEELRLCKKEIKRREDFCDELKSKLQKHIEGCDIVPYGSTVNKLGMNDSDLDLLLVSSESDVGAMMNKVAKLLRSNVSGIHDIRSFGKGADSFRMIKFEHNRTKCDFSLTATFSPRNTSYLCFLQAVYPYFTQLAFFFRLWLKFYKLTGIPNGVTSYAATLMVVFFLQKTRRLVALDELMAHKTSRKVTIQNRDLSFPDIEHAHIFRKNDNEDLSDVAKEMFEFFVKIDWKKTALNLRTGQFEDRPESSSTTANVMCVWDPFDVTHNICGKVTTAIIKDLRQCFNLASLVVQGHRYRAKQDQGEWGVLLLLDSNNLVYTKRWKKQLVPGILAKYQHDTMTTTETTKKGKADHLIKLKPRSEQDPNLLLTLFVRVLTDVFQIQLDSDAELKDQVVARETASVWTKTTTATKKDDNEVESKPITRKRPKDDDVEAHVKRSKIAIEKHLTTVQHRLPMTASCQVGTKLWVGRRSTRRRLVSSTAPSRTDVLDIERQISALLLSQNVDGGGDSPNTSTSSSCELFSMRFDFEAKLDDSNDVTLIFKLVSTEHKRDFDNFVHYLQTFLPNLFDKLESDNC